MMGVDDAQKMETAMSTIAQFQLGTNHPVTLSSALDKLAVEYDQRFEEPDPKTLSKFLFQNKMLVGNQSDYFNPQNSNWYFADTALIRSLDCGVG